MIERSLHRGWRALACAVLGAVSLAAAARDLTIGIVAAPDDACPAGIDVGGHLRPSGVDAKRPVEHEAEI